MPLFKAPLRDMRFVLDEVFNANEFWQANPAMSHVDLDTVNAILEEMAKFSENVLLPINRSGDEEGCTFNNGVVTTPKGFKEAFKQYAEGGWIGLGAEEEFGGQAMPKMVTVLTDEMLFATNPSFTLYPLLTIGAGMAMTQHAGAELNNLYLPKMYSGEWAGTMCLTEPHSGTDLGIIRTKAEPQADGSFLISGTKIFITGGEHDLCDNHIHLVLAKLPDAPAGSRGISLFLVPKFHVNADGSLGERNTVAAGSIEHKMGIKGSATCVMNFDAAKGYLVGKVNEGLAAMFVMMNYERLSMGIQGLGASEAAYQNAAAYARDRLQGRSATGVKMPEKNADSLLVHPDVRRMLLKIRANNEAGRAFAIYAAQQLDLNKYSEDPAVRKAAADRVALLTPVVKAYLTDKGLENCIEGQQVLGGHGYIREWGLEQWVRDTRIAQIYEGTNGVQAHDLMGRKVAKNDGVFVASYLAEIRAFNETLAGDASLDFMRVALAQAADEIESATQWVVEQSKVNPDEINAAAVDYMHAFGLLSFAYMWAKLAKAAAGKSDTFYIDKLKLARFFVTRQLPELTSRIATIKAGADSVMQFDMDYFA
ncbi:MAG: acyl-CoA dehydrogenase C-terminal domain-containing protein [Fluviicoccus sp.]|uniref:acyl-CoA dehydrogenase C-terminal domain-containing protein n=1 Tax=Fluviicoccus sp. TaxID=2003552 RepID=UPI002727EE4C|nr:acyl-CoA dehydrogenase C-terminal domain-containing protein [Fluviicoccus sp.]MDO8329520.1 acyl-CoA dehydrogenase C-terminal domain-containing protein [Fluviicoccus sp.]